VRVSVRTPFSFVVVITVSSGPSVVAVVLVVFAFVFAVLSLLAQLAVSIDSARTDMIVRNFLNTFSPSYPYKSFFSGKRYTAPTVNESA
jgi:hypothetical protein